ncbi:Lysophospholipid acyltransferase, partial [Globisporangium splendens]
MDRIVELVAAAQPYADLVSPLTFDAANAQVASLSASLGLATDQLRYVLCLFAAYPLAVVYKLLPSASLKHVFDIVVGVLLAQFVLGSGWVHSFISSFITYVLVKFGPAKYAPYIVFLFNMTYMSASHIYRLYVDYMGWTLDFTGPQMLLVIKLTSFAYNYYDGVVDKTGDKKDLSPGLARVYAGRKKLALTEIPSLLEFFGYVYSFTTFLAGPAFEIREYLDATSGKKFIFKGQYKQPSSAFASFSKFLVGVFFMGFYAHFGPQFPISNLHTADVAALPWYFQIKELYFTLILCKAKYYGAWKIAEGATVLCGFGFEGFTEEGKAKGWNGVSNMDIIGFEFAQSVREGSRAWNKGTQTWLERYVYARTGNSLMATYFISAFWHGFYPGYYLFFMSLPLATSVNRLAFKRVRPYFLESDGSSGLKKKFYDLVSTIATLLTMHYFVMPFQAMSWENSLKTLQNTHYAGHIVCAVLYVVFSLVPVPKSAAAKKKTA